MMKAGKIPEIPIILDSPMAVKATQVYSRYPEELTKAVQSSGYIDFLQSKNIELIQDVESSRQLQERRGPFILVSASGMCQGGRILHHLRSRLGDSRNVLLFVGYQAESSLGFQILNGNRRIKLLGENIFVQCQLDYIGSFSSHADQAGLVDFFVKAPGEMPKRVFLNHGTEESRTALAGLLEPEGYQVFLPRNEAVYYL
jgi:metallo-beta-lactamase family protein